MKQRLKTVVLDANRTDYVSVAIDTFLQGVLRIPERWSHAPFISRRDLSRRLVGRRYDAVSYIADWREAFETSAELDTRVVNVTNLVAYRTALPDIRDADLVVVLHSALGDDVRLLNQTAHWLHRRRGRMCVFIGNEYDLIEEKKRFVTASGAEFICSQIPIDTARWLYADCSSAQVIEMPHALNPGAYCDLGRARSIDIGFIGDLYERTVGDTERTDLIRYFARLDDSGLRCDIRVNGRVSRRAWNLFLNECRGIIGAESGSYYVDRKAKAIECAKAFQRAHPEATFDEVFHHCFRTAGEFRSGKAISSRHFEPIGTKTCQILIEGHYNGILVPGEHYISVRRDLSDIGEALARFQDESHRLTIVNRAYDHVMSGHTYAHRIRFLVGELTHSSSPRLAMSSVDGPRSVSK